MLRFGGAFMLGVIAVVMGLVWHVSYPLMFSVIAV